MENEKQCPICKKESHLKCGSCSSSWYCSVEHQKEHWKVHRKNCSYFQIKDVPDLGKGFVATRNIKADTVIIEEYAVLSATQFFNPGFEECLTCAKVVILGECKGCSKCDWPCCSLDCEKNPIHTENECDVFLKANFTPATAKIYAWDTHAISMVVLIIQAGFLKKRNPQVYDQILQLCSSYSLPKSDDIQDTKIVKCQIQFSEFLNYANMQREELRKLWRILNINLYANQYSRLIGGVTVVERTRGLFLKISRINHSCTPNATWTIGGAPGKLKLRIVTTSDVQKGEAITVNYNRGNIFLGTLKRQKELQRNNYFICKCKRCVNPTEFGTFLSAVVCQHCSTKTEGNNSGSKTKVLDQVGYVLPEDPTDLTKSAKWKCQRCQRVNMYSEISTAVKAVMLEKRKLYHAAHGDKGNLVDACKGLVDNYPDILHCNHWMLHEARLEIMRGVHRDMDCEALSNSIQHGMDALTMMKILSPGHSYNLALLEECLGKAFYYLIGNLMFKKKFREAKEAAVNSLRFLRHANEYNKHRFPRHGDLLERAAEVSETIASIETVNAQLSVLLLAK